MIFSRTINKTDHPPLYFNENLVKSSSTHKHLGMILDTKLDFSLHLKYVQNKANKTIGFLRKLQDTLPRTLLITIFKSFIRPHLDYGDIIYDRAYNTSFHQNIESIQYNAALAITGAVRGTSREKLYQELGFESLQQRRWYRKLCCLFKIINNQSVTELSLSISLLTMQQIFCTKLRKHYPTSYKIWLFKKLLFTVDYERVDPYI